MGSDQLTEIGCSAYCKFLSLNVEALVQINSPAKLPIQSLCVSYGLTMHSKASRKVAYLIDDLAATWIRFAERLILQGGLFVFICLYPYA